MREVVPFLKERYRTGPCAVVGTSSGGYGALSLALRYPDLFPAAGSNAGDAFFEDLLPARVPGGVPRDSRRGRPRGTPPPGSLPTDKRVRPGGAPGEDAEHVCLRLLLLSPGRRGRPIRPAVRPRDGGIARGRLEAVAGARPRAHGHDRAVPFRSPSSSVPVCRWWIEGRVRPRHRGARVRGTSPGIRGPGRSRGVRWDPRRRWAPVRRFPPTGADRAGVPGRGSVCR